MSSDLATINGQTLMPEGGHPVAQSQILKIIGDYEMLLTRQQAIINIKDKIMVKGVHYGPPYQGSQKDVLLKSGGELLASFFGLRPRYRQIETVERWDATPEAPALFHYRYECELVDVVTGMVVGSGIGSCNSMESRYRWRDGRRACPECGNTETLLKSKNPPRNAPQGTPPGWYCFAKKGGCGKEFAHNDPRVINQVIGKVDNDDIYTQVNTIDKQAQKRAFMEAVMKVTGASAWFMEDVEDLPGYNLDAAPHPRRQPEPELTVITRQSEPRQPGVDPATDPEPAPHYLTLPQHKNALALLFKELEPLTGKTSKELAALALDALGIASFTETALPETELHAAIRNMAAALMPKAEPKAASASAAPAADDVELENPVEVAHVRYVKQGNNGYLEFIPRIWNPALTIRVYGRSSSFKAMVGDDYYTANGFDTMTPNANEPVKIAPLSIEWETKGAGAYQYRINKLDGVKVIEPEKVPF